MEQKAPRINLPKEGDDARSTGRADQNETVSAEERSGKPRSELSDGPKLGKFGEYLPARYERTTVVQTPAGPVTTKYIVEDR